MAPADYRRKRRRLRNLLRGLLSGKEALLYMLLPGQERLNLIRGRYVGFLYTPLNFGHLNFVVNLGVSGMYRPGYVRAWQGWGA
jgi:hypothetical protein